jgi:hypothetical protein
VKILVLAVASAALGGFAALAHASEEHDYQDRPQDCAGCHATLEEDEGFELADGTFLSARVDEDSLTHSVHGSDLECTDCHRRMRGYPHEPVRALGEREYRLEMAQTCNRCHYDHFTHLLDSMHFEQIREENLDAPTCIDCHDNHAIQPPSEPRLAISDRCATCHDEIAETYAASIHGQSLAEGFEDAPVCTDCHGAHAIEGAKNETFHAGSYQICAKCHGDEEKMEAYELNTNVLRTYLDDFHGASNHIYTKVGYIPERPIATCGDCHGVHDVQRFEHKEDAVAIRERTTEMCQSCHEDADSSFAGAWLAHEDPSLQSSPFVWAVLWGYRLLIPLMVIALLTHILLHFWRAAVEHAQKGAQA